MKGMLWNRWPWSRRVYGCFKGRSLVETLVENRYTRRSVLRWRLIEERDTAFFPVCSAWSDLMSHMTEELVNNTYGEPYYSYQPLQYYGDMRVWYEEMRGFADIDRKVLFDSLIYSPHQPKESEMDMVKEERAFFARFDQSRMRGYNIMWNKIRPAFERWIEERRRFIGCGGSTSSDRTRLSHLLRRHRARLSGGHRQTELWS